MTSRSNQQVTITGFNRSDIKLVDVTVPGDPSVISAKIVEQDTGYGLSLAVPGPGERALLAFGGDNVRSALSLSLNQPTRWRREANHADLVIITHRSLIESLDRLARHRRAQGLKVALIDVEDLYDEFSFGHKSPQAIKDFLRYAGTNWIEPPKYVLLAGTASYDPKDYNGFGSYDLVPTRLIDTGFSETASDDWFADFTLDGIPELAVGRLPVQNAEEAARIIAKLIEYDSNSTPESALLVADENNGFDFEGTNDRLARLFPGSIFVKQINRAQVGSSEAKRRLLEGIAGGQRIVNYVGHGSPSAWKASLLTAADALSLTNERFPLFVLMTCLNGQFQHPQLNVLATALMNAHRGGAIAVWASSGLTEPRAQVVMNQRFYTELFQQDRKGRGPRLGEAVLRAKAIVGDPDVRRTWILFGDPSMRLR